MKQLPTVWLLRAGQSRATAAAFSGTCLPVWVTEIEVYILVP